MNPAASTRFLSVILVFSLCSVVDGADDPAAAAPSSVGSVKMTPGEVARKIEEALKVAQEALKAFYSDDALTFVNSLLNPAETITPWFVALATAHRQIPLLFKPNKPSDPDLKVLKTALKNVLSNYKQIQQKEDAIEPGFPNNIISSEFYEQTFTLFKIAQDYSIYVPEATEKFLEACSGKETAENVASRISGEITGGGSKILNYFEDSCNYTEIVLRSRQVALVYTRACQLHSFCYGVESSKIPESDFNSTVNSRGKLLDEDWAEIAAKFYSALTGIKQLKNCLPVFTDSIDFYSKRNKDLGHEQFATGLASNLLEKFPWINWYVFSYDDGLGGAEEHSCIGGILSHCIQRKYGRNLFVAGQQNEDNYFYNKDCPEQKECVKKLDQYKNCADATKPFEDCMKEKCKPPAGTLCKKSGDGFAAEKGKTASSDGWNKFKFGTDTKYFMQVVSP